MAGGPPPGLPLEVTELSFYYSNFANSEEAASYVILNYKGPGTFLLRPSTRCPGALTLTISTGPNAARHVNVLVKPDDRSVTGISFFIIPERTFSSFHELYNYYSLTPICNMENVNNVKLLNPLEKFPPLPGPTVMADEIPPLPRRQSLNSGIGMDSVRSDGALEETRRMSNTSQTGLPEVPPISGLPEVPPISGLPEIPPISGFPEIPPIPGLAEVPPNVGLPEIPSMSLRRDRPSLDSQGNDLQVWSSNSSGSGAALGRPRLGHNGQAPQYLAPGSPGSSNQSKTKLFTMPRSSASNQFYDPPPPQPTTLSKKQLKEEQKKREKEEKKKNKEKKKQAAEMSHMGELGWCRPPMPIPSTQTAQGDDNPYYTSPRPYRDHLEELKKMLRESEICDCGLRMMDAELVQGWTVHRSREQGTFKRVFYQHENGNTTWQFPEVITADLTDAQVKFIAHLCWEGNQDLPVEVMRRYQRLTPTAPGGGNFPFTPVNSSRSRSSSNSSDQLGFSRSPPF